MPEKCTAWKTDLHDGDITSHSVVLHSLHVRLGCVFSTQRAAPFAPITHAFEDNNMAYFIIETTDGRGAACIGILVYYVQKLYYLKIIASGGFSSDCEL